MTEEQQSNMAEQYRALLEADYNERQRQLNNLKRGLNAARDCQNKWNTMGVIGLLISLPVIMVVMGMLHLLGVGKF